VLYNRIWDTSGPTPTPRFRAGSRLRLLDLCGCNGGSNVAVASDAHSPSDYSYYPQSQIRSVGITSFDPVSSPDGSLALANSYWPGRNFLSIVKVTCSSPLPLTAPLQLASLDLATNGGGTPFPDTSTSVGNNPPTGTLLYGSNPCVILDSSHFLMACYSYCGPTGGQTATLAGSHTPDGNRQVQITTGLNSAPFEDAISFCNELGMDCWYETEVLAQDSLNVSRGQYAAANLASGRKIALAFGNEIWNPFGGGNFQWAYAMLAKFSSDWSTTGKLILF
jgi:hypothetical protein